MPASHHKALDNSPFLAGLVQRHPHWFDELNEEGRLDTANGPAEKDLRAFVTDYGLDPGLRKFRNREMMRIVWRELERIASVEQTLADLSDLADLCLQNAMSAHDHALREKHGQPIGPEGEPQSLVTLGLGKLGGHELNLSSDIDVIFCFPWGGETDGKRRIANEQYFQRQARAVIRSLGEITGDGFCFRVDTRLRPFGDSGPLVCSFGAMEQYYQREGRDWERYALVKARSVAGDREAGEQLIQNLRPFVYRRYIDYGAVEALREMRTAVHEDAQRRDRQLDVKRGAGGIRDIEFLVQCLQLLSGGREPSLQTPSLMTALDGLERLELLPSSLAQPLREDYRFLRRLENAIQALHDRQEHCLPEGEDRSRVVHAMGYTREEALLEAFHSARQRVSATVEARFPRNDESSTPSNWTHSLEASEHPPGQAIQRFRDRLERMALSQRAAARLNRFMPMLLSRMALADTPEDVQADVLELVAGVCRRSAYLSLLVENPGALDRMLELFTRSQWIAKTVIRYPALLDELIDPSLGEALPTREETSATLRRLLAPGMDTESALLALNHLKRAVSLRIAVAELAGRVDAQGTQALLTDLAESLLEAALDVAQASMAERHGQLPDAGLAIIAYGSLGSGEMSYGSDLDLIFLYRAGHQPSDGQKPLEPEHYYTRLTRRVLALVTTLTAAGRLYEVDTRLRPNGRSGLLVSTLDAFERYQTGDAWTWELQALIRARASVGDKVVQDAFEQIRQQVLLKPRPADTLASEVREMRAKMRASLQGGDPLKHAPGAMVDIDFVTQLGVLVCAPKHPKLLGFTSTRLLLPLLAQTGWISEAAAEQLADTHLLLAQARHAKALSRGGLKQEPPLEASRATCTPLLGPPSVEKQASPG